GEALGVPESRAIPVAAALGGRLLEAELGQQQLHPLLDAPGRIFPLGIGHAVLLRRGVDRGSASIRSTASGNSMNAFRLLSRNAWGSPAHCFIATGIWRVSARNAHSPEAARGVIISRNRRSGR